MTKILWVSRHTLMPSQKAALAALYGEIEVIRDRQPFDSAEGIAERFRKGGYKDLVAIVPLSVLQKLVDLGLKPLWAEMEQVPADQAEFTAAGKHYRFVRFRRVKRLLLEFEEP